MIVKDVKKSHFSNMTVDKKGKDLPNTSNVLKSKSSVSNIKYQIPIKNDNLEPRIPKSPNRKNTVIKSIDQKISKAFNLKNFSSTTVNSSVKRRSKSAEHPNIGDIDKSVKPASARPASPVRHPGVDSYNKENVFGINSAPTSKVDLVKAVEPPVPITSIDAFKRSNSYAENKYKVTITSERLAKLRSIVEQALREHKVFTIKGGWGVVRRELLKRNWVEKFENSKTRPTTLSNINNNLSSSDDITSNLPRKQDWESPAAYKEKCERTIMSRMLQAHDVDLYWSSRKDQSDILHRSNTYKVMSRFGKSLFASKEGLALLLQQSYWYTEPGVSSINFPRCYVLGFPEHFNMFVEDFRLTACIGLLKWLFMHYNAQDKNAVEGFDGEVPIAALKFAMMRCKEFLESKKHIDIDKNYERIWDHEWESFITNYYRVVHENKKFFKTQDYSMPVLFAKCKNLLDELTKYWPDMTVDGIKNIWILKPGNKCRGRGIQLVKSIGAVERTMSMKLKYVVQKYIERPLLIYKTKFDIRQWFLVSSVQPLIIWMYRECYLRFSSQIFTLENFHESLHLTNYSVQCKYTNVEERSKSLPKDNMWDCHTFKAYLTQAGSKEKWQQIIYPGMRESIVCAMLASQDVMDRRPNTFELYGADFMIAEDFKPWLIEINCCPDLSLSTSVTRRMCPKCLEDIIKVTVDKRRDPQADTGLFDCIYRQFLPRIPPYLGMNLAVKGKRLFRGKHNKKFKERDETKKPQNGSDEIPPHLPYFRKDLIKKNIKVSISKIRHQIPSPKAQYYSGPVIEDLLANVQNSNSPNCEGISFVPVITSAKVNNAVVASAPAKRERVSSNFNDNKIKINVVNSAYRTRRNVKGNRTEKERKRMLGAFNEWTTKFNNEIQKNMKKNRIWEQENISILKGRNIFKSNINKNYSNNHCFDFDLNLSTSSRSLPPF